LLRKVFHNTLGQLLPVARSREKAIRYNPKRIVAAATDQPTLYKQYLYNEKEYQHLETTHFNACVSGHHSNMVEWINIDGLRKNEVEAICKHYKIHFLTGEDILSVGQRAKYDDMDNLLFILLPMLTYNEDSGLVQSEQLSIVLEKNLVLSFQSDPAEDPFDPIRERIKNTEAPIRKKEADYLAYSLLDAVVDDYFTVLEKLSNRLDFLEDEVINRPNKSVLMKASILRQEIMMVKRSITPVRELVSGLWQSDNSLIQEVNRKYFKDVYDHIILAIEYTENYREMALSLQDLYMNQVNTRMNEVMKILTVVTTLLAPATVVSGIFGMNFKNMPFIESEKGFNVAMGIMVVVAFLMLLFFRRKRWF
jgi:magnesium transporter